MAREAPQLQHLQQITIAPRKTQFWRFQQKSENHLATIEAIYYTYREYAEAYEGPTYHGQYDNLMFYYRFFYNMIQDRYRKDQGRAFNHRHRQGYIQYDTKKKQKADDDQQEAAKSESPASSL
jgi:DTW domain-containing protein YfiP